MALEIASGLVKNEMVYAAEGANFKCLSRDEVVIDKELNLQPAESSTSDAIDSSSGSTMSVDETDSGVDDGDDDDDD